MWGGRFSEPPSEALWRFTVDHSDRRLLADDITGSLAHVSMLGEVGILEQADVDAITTGLEEIRIESDEGQFEFLETDEDVHSAVERRLYELIGSPAGKLHTGRSRNDQIALDIRLYLRRTAGERIDDLIAFAVPHGGPGRGAGGRHRGVVHPPPAGPADLPGNPSSCLWLDGFA